MVYVISNKMAKLQLIKSTTKKHKNLHNIINIRCETNKITLFLINVLTINK